MNETRAEFELLFCALLEGDATREEQARLAEILRAEPALRAEYVRQMRLNALLEFTAGLPATRIKTQPPSKVRRFPFRKMAAAAALLLGALVAGVWLSSGPVAMPVLAVVKASLHGQWATGGEVLAGTELMSGVVEVQSGLVELEMRSGAVLLVEAPASLEFKDALHARLLAGRLVVRMRKGDSGFVVEMPELRVTDLGTEFGVSVTLNGESQVQVFDGKVRVESKLAPAQRELGEGDSVMVRTGSGSLAPTQFSEDRFIRRFPAPKPGADSRGALYSKSTLDSVRVAPVRAPVVIDGDLAEWNRAGAFRSACLPPFDQTYFLEGMMMYDAQNLYLAAHVGDPDPMRNTAPDEMDFTGGALVVRVSTDRKLGWPLQGTVANALSRDQSKPPLPDSLSDRVGNLVMSYHAISGQPRLRLIYGFDGHGETKNPSGWQGAFRKDADGRGYTLEYKIPWQLLHCADDPPRSGDVMAANWRATWSDAEGRISRGQLVEVTNFQPPPDLLKVSPSNFWKFGPCWGRAIYLPAEN